MMLDSVCCYVSRFFAVSYRHMYTLSRLYVLQIIHRKPTMMSEGILCPSVRCISKKEYAFPTIMESDLKEAFMRGSGPGGQSVSTSNNCVQLTHVPTGVQIKVHDTRSLEQNRKIARERLKEHVDLHINGDNSYLTRVARDKQQNKADKRSRTRKRLEMKRTFKENLANNEES